MESKIEIDETEQSVFVNQLEMYLSIYMDELGITDASKMSQSRWTGFLMFAYDHIFKNRDVFNQKTTKNKCIDLDICLDVCISYVALCYRYEKVISIHGFSRLTGIDRVTIDNWRTELHRSSEPQAKQIWELLNCEYEQSLESALVSSGKNPIGIIAILNRRYNWKENAKLLDDTPKQSIGFNDLPQLTGNGLPELPEIKED